VWVLLFFSTKSVFFFAASFRKCELAQKSMACLLFSLLFQLAYRMKCYEKNGRIATGGSFWGDGNISDGLPER
jgi:hypothetical protein